MVALLLERLDYVRCTLLPTQFTSLTPLLQIVYNVFPMPRVPPYPFNQQPFPTPPTSSNSENAAMGNSLTSPRPQATSTGSPSSSERVPDSQSQSSTQQRSETLPPPLAFLLNSIRSSINSSFTEKPPHTIQRLAELILRPTTHYRTLPAYLRAVDRVVSVTSSADIFPFQMPASSAAQSNGLVHPGNHGASYLATDTYSFGHDESFGSLGGALLTPIPWLSNVSLEGEVANTLEQGEWHFLSSRLSWFLLPSCRRILHGFYGLWLITGSPGVEEAIPTQQQNVAVPENEDSGATVSSPPPDQSEEMPHARGPPVLGVEDLGLQDGKGVQMALEGTQVVPQDDGAMDTRPTTAPGTSTGEGAQNLGESAIDKDGDIKLEDSNNPKGGEKPETEKNSESQASGVEQE